MNLLKNEKYFLSILSENRYFSVRGSYFIKISTIFRKIIVQNIQNWSA